MRLLKSSDYVYEMDLAACFNNINKPQVLKNLQEIVGLPAKIISIIEYFINVEGVNAPLEELAGPATYFEVRTNNTEARKAIGLPQGLPISPFLANVQIYSCLKKCGLLERKGLSWLFYADDFLLLLTKAGYEFFKDVSLWNNSEIFIKHGLRFDGAKSGLVKSGGKWLKPLVALGLSYNGETGTLSSKTRGRTATPKNPKEVPPKSQLLQPN